MSQVANATLRSTLSLNRLNKTKENESTEIIFSFRERMSFDQCRYVGVEHQVNESNCCYDISSHIDISQIERNLVIIPKHQIKFL